MNTESNTLQKNGLESKLLNKEFFLQILNRDQLKYIAIILMTLGHWALKLAKYGKLRALLKFAVSAEFFAPPVFFFFIAEGFHYTKSPKKYAIRLLICAVITQIPHTLVLPDHTLKTFLLQWNVIMTLFLGLLALIVIHSTLELWQRILAVTGLLVVSRLIMSEWWVSGIIIILCFDLLREKPLKRFLAVEVLIIIAMIFQVGVPDLRIFTYYYLPPMLAVVAITFFYNGNKGHFPQVSKYFFYVWYPLHLLIELFI